MNLDQIRALIKQQESQTFELKKSSSQLHPAFETVCGFLNALGGIVLIGVTDSGRIVGQDVTDNTKREIAREINKIEPSASVEVHYVELENNKFVIVIQVDKGVHAPYTYDARPYQRDESNTTRMSQHRYEQLLVRAVSKITRGNYQLLMVILWRILITTRYI